MTALLGLSAKAQKSNIMMSGRIVNYFTRQAADSVRLELLAADSSYICEARIYYRKSNRQVDLGANMTQYLFENIERGSYILRCTSSMYETACQPLEVKFSKRAMFVEGPDVEVRPRMKTRRLNEVAVTATKVKFYHRGDTLVYNADAFNLSEGSMLDALVGQLPGAELKADGRILVNGRFIESLLLNGRDFFKGDNRVMLDNLPAYMVKKIQVYDREDEFNPRDEKIYTMDVRLKREYEVGWLANVTGGYGTDNRYMGRLFGLRFTRQSRIAVFGNVNNVNEDRIPGLDGKWTPANMQRGLLETKQFGVDYQVYDKDGVWRIEGNTVGNFAHSVNSALVSQENYLSGGNTYGQAYRHTAGDNLSVKTDNTITWIQKNRSSLRVYPKVSYARNKNRAESVGATFAERPQAGDGWALIDSIRHLADAATLRRSAINRTMEQTLYRSHEWKAGATFNGSQYLDADYWNTLYYDGGINYQRLRRKDFNQYALDYYRQEAATDLRNRYNALPQSHVDANARLSFSSRSLYVIEKYKKFYFTPAYEYRYRYDNEEVNRYRLDRLAEWAVYDENMLGSLPDGEALAACRDTENSREETTNEHQHIVSTSFQFNRFCFGRKENLGLDVRLTLPLKVVSEHTGEQRAMLDTVLSRTAVLFNPSLKVMFDFNRKSKKPYEVGGTGVPTFSFSYNMEQQLPRHIYLLNVTDNTNPLYITYGNADLQRTVRHNLSLNFLRSSRDSKPYYNATLRYRKTDNAVVMGYVYDRQTGVHHVTPANVDGNWDGSASFGLMLPLDKHRRWTLTSDTEGSLNHNVDLVGVKGSDASSERSVNTLRLSERIRLDYRMNDKVSLGLRSRVGWTNADSKAEGFMELNAMDYSNGVVATVALPHDFGFSTDLICYTRTGYNDPAMNTTEVVWNARLTRSLIHGKLLLKLEGWDILGQLSNIQRAINAQGRTETLYNVIPRYAMLTATWHLSKKAEKK